MATAAVVLPAPPLVRWEAALVGAMTEAHFVLLLWPVAVGQRVLCRQGAFLSDQEWGQPLSQTRVPEGLMGEASASLGQGDL